MSSHKQMICVAACLALMGTAAKASGAVSEQTAPNQQLAGKPLVVPIDYVIGPEDVLTITVDGQDPTLHSGDVVVRPDGKISRPSKPGEYSLRDSMDLLQILVKAGGLTPYADKENIHIIRRHADGKIETIVFSYTKVFEPKGVIGVPQLRPGDQVIAK